ncbi:MAG: thioredoxin family protein [Bdellovibrionaceae bacterium]|nr:thioredoxin family protein [Pseudobdellovibrionaceae bacterium]
MIHSFFLQLAIAHASASLRSSNTVKYEIKDSVFQAQILKGFHFNEKAPNTVLIDDRPQPIRLLLADKIEFKLSSAPWKKAVATLYVCDDALTFCEEQTFDLLGKKRADPQQYDLLVSSIPAFRSASFSESARSKAITRDKHNFLLNNFEYAVKIAKKSKKLVLVDFSADWCPGCIRLDQEVFATKSFREVASSFVLLKIDTDLPENKGLRELYQVHHIPVLLILNSEGNEIVRLNDYQPLAVIENQVRELKKDSSTITELSAKHPLDPNTASRLGLRLLAQGNAKAAMFYLEQVAPRPAEFLDAKVEIARQAGDNSKLKEALEAAIKSESDSTRSLRWRKNLIQILKVENKSFVKFYQEGRALGKKLLIDEKALPIALSNDRLGDYLGYERLYIATLIAELSETAEQSIETLKADWADVYRIGKSYSMGSSQMGPAMRFLSLLMTQRMWSEANDFSDRLLITSPNNSELKRRKVKILKELVSMKSSKATP